ncbi:hypothetical protein ACFWFX_18665 [Streptomyces roseolus]|uniref:hypothetical protein n=1 Tax=Streptomyces roseolus TaxID=67358 RepID=UPI0036491609
MVKVSGTFYVADGTGHDIDISLAENGEVSVFVLGDIGVATLDHEGVQPLLDILTFVRDMADKYGVSE